ncbi:MAG: ribonuclease III [Cyanobacteria bacterium REEB67]|nr:ribonuclease III [Cyanobacteria bacterium REEB67]
MKAAVSITNVISVPDSHGTKSASSHSHRMNAQTTAINPKRFKELDQLCHKLGVTCGRMGLVNEALTHSSYAAEHAAEGIKDSEKLEFFGDAVLRFIISEYLLERFPDYDEGKLTELRAVLVSDRILAEIAQEIGLSKYILLGQKVQMRPSIMAQALEALIGAIYQDLGLFTVQTLLVRVFGHQTTVCDRDEVKDNYKQQLQEYTQGKSMGIPIYSLVHSEGPSHDLVFTVSVEVSGKIMAQGVGKSKKAAEQEAAKAAYQILVIEQSAQSA